MIVNQMVLSHIHTLPIMINELCVFVAKLETTPKLLNLETVWHLSAYQRDTSPSALVVADSFCA